MRRVAIVARLREGQVQRAKELIDQGPPFNLRRAGFVRHSVYLSASEAVFVFEGRDVVWKLDDLTTDSFHPALQGAFAAWEPVIEGRPKVASEAYFWDALGEGEERSDSEA